jgi:hypothetical protein
MAAGCPIAPESTADHHEARNSKGANLMICAGGAVERDGDARHALLCYDSPESLCARAVPYVREGLARGEAVTAVVAADVAQVLGAALGDDAARVRWQAGGVSYGRLGAMFERFRRFLAEQRAAGVPMRLLAQNDTLGTEERMAAYLRFEAMANEVYRPYGHRWACLYDTRAHSPQTLRQVSQVHPRLLEPGGREIPNDDYLEPSAYLARSRTPVGAENAVTSCDLHVLVHETAEPVASEGLDSCAGGRGSGPCGRVLIERSVWTVRVVVLEVLV